jgi:hypothetical protein
LPGFFFSESGCPGLLRFFGKWVSRTAPCGKWVSRTALAESGCPGLLLAESGCPGLPLRKVGAPDCSLRKVGVPDCPGKWVSRTAPRTAPESGCPGLPLRKVGVPDCSRTARPDCSDDVPARRRGAFHAGAESAPLLQGRVEQNLAQLPAPARPVAGARGTGGISCALNHPVQQGRTAAERHP